MTFSDLLQALAPYWHEDTSTFELAAGDLTGEDWDAINAALEASVKDAVLTISAATRGEDERNQILGFTGTCALLKLSDTVFQPLTASFFLKAGRPVLVVSTAGEAQGFPDGWTLPGVWPALVDTTLEAVFFATGQLTLSSADLQGDEGPEQGLTVGGRVDTSRGAPAGVAGLLSTPDALEVAGLVDLSDVAPQFSLRGHGDEAVTLGALILITGLRFDASVMTATSELGEEAPYPFSSAALFGQVNLDNGGESTVFELQAYLTSSGDGAINLIASDMIVSLSSWSVLDVWVPDAQAVMGGMVPDEAPTSGALILSGMSAAIDVDALTVTSMNFNIGLGVNWEILPAGMLTLSEFGGRFFMPSSVSDANLIIYGDFVVADSFVIEVSITVPELVLRAELADGSIIPLTDLFNQFYGSLTGDTVEPPFDTPMDVTEFEVQVDVNNGAYSVDAAVQTALVIPMVVTDITLTDLTSGVAWSGNALLAYFSATFLVGDTAMLVNIAYNDGAWAFSAGTGPTSTISMLDLVGFFLDEDFQPPDFIRSDLLVGQVLLAMVLPSDPEQDASYQVTAATASPWAFNFGGVDFSIQASVDIRYADQELAGEIWGEVTILDLDLQARYAFSSTNQVITFTLTYQRVQITAALTSQVQGEQTRTWLRFGFGDLSLGEILAWLVSVATGEEDFSLPAPWSLLNSINLANLHVDIQFEPTRAVTISYDVNADLGFMSVTSIGVVYEDEAGEPRVRLALSGSFLGQEYDSERGTGLEWDVLNEDPPEVPAEGLQLIEVRYVALGQRVSFGEEQLRTISTVGGAIEAMRQEMVPVEHANQNPLTAGGAVGMRFNHDSHLLFGLDVTLMRTVSLAIVFNDPLLYGLRVSLAGERAGSFSGLSFELLYKRVTDDIGMFRVELRLPEAFRQLEFGEVSVTLPVLELEVYTNGNFRLDLGFPAGGDFSDSFALQIFPFVGYGGFYIASLTGATSSSVPQVSNGNFAPVIEFGLGLSVGLGKEIREGVLSGGLTLTLEAICEGTLAWFTSNDQQTTDEMYYRLEGSAAIVGKLYGKVDFKVVKVSVSIEARAGVSLVFEAYQATNVTFKASVTAKAEAKVAFVKVSFDFDATIEESFTFGHASTPPWRLVPGAPAPSSYGGGSSKRALRSQRPRQRSALRRHTAALDHAARRGPQRRLERAAEEEGPQLPRWTEPVYLYGEGVTETLGLWLLPALSAMGDDPQTATLQVAPLLFIPNGLPAEAGGAGESDPAFDTLLEGLLRWAFVAGLGKQGQDQVERDELDALNLSLRDPDVQAQAFSYATLSQLMQDNYVLEIQALPEGEPDTISATVFPMIPELTMSWDVDQSVDFGSYGPVGEAYEAGLQAYYAQMDVDYEAGRADRLTPDWPEVGEPGGDTESMATFVFRDWFMALTRAAVQAAADMMDALQHPVVESDSLDGVAAQFVPHVTDTTVRVGDTIDSVCDEWSMTVEELMALNHLDQPVLPPPGTQLLVTVSVTARSVAASNPYAPLQSGAEALLVGVQVQVTDGLSLADVVERFGLDGLSGLLVQPIGGVEPNPNAADTQLLRPGASLQVAEVEGGVVSDSFTMTSVAEDTLDTIAAWVYVRARGEVDRPAVDWYAQGVQVVNPGVDLGGALDPSLSPLTVPAGLEDTSNTTTLPLHPGDTLELVAWTLEALREDSPALQAIRTWIQDNNAGLDFGDLPPGTVVQVPAQSCPMIDGDSLLSLSARFGVSVQELGEANQGSDTLLRPLGVLELPDITHVVEAGETLGGLAASYNLSLEALTDAVAGDTGLLRWDPQSVLEIPALPQHSVDALVEAVLISPTGGSSLADQASAQLSRYFLHGLRVPPPGEGFEQLSTRALRSGARTEVSLSGLYTQTGQQLPIPELSEGPLTLSFTSTGVAWVDFAEGGDVLVLDEAYVQAEGPSTSFDPELLGPPTASAPAQQTPRRYGFADPVPWQAGVLPPFGDSGSAQAPLAGEPSLWPLPGALRARAVAQTAPDLSLLTATEAEDSLAAVQRWSLGTLVELGVRQVMSSDGADATPLANSYLLTGMSVADREVLYLTWLWLQANGEAGTSVWLLSAPASGSPNAKGLASGSLNEEETFILKANLSTLTNSGQALKRRALAEEGAGAGEPLISARLRSVTDFLTLIWESSVTNSGGYFLRVEDSEGQGLPDAVFSEGRDGVVQLLVLLGPYVASAGASRALLPLHTCVVVGDNIDPSQQGMVAEVVTPEDRDMAMLPVMPPGVVGFDLLRRSPALTQDLAEQRTQALFSLLGFQVDGEGSTLETSNVGLPAGPTGSDEDVAGVDKDDVWRFHQALNVAPLARLHPLPAHDALPDPLLDPYAGIGADTSATLALAFVDYLGNSLAPTTPFGPLEAPLGYTDLLIGLSRWPGLSKGYRVSGQPGAVLLDVGVTLQTSAYVPGPAFPLRGAQQAASAHLSRYTQIYYQLEQADVSARVETSLDEAVVGSPYAYDLPEEQLAALKDFVRATYVFLGGCVALEAKTLTVTEGQTLSSVAAGLAAQDQAPDAWLPSLAEENQDLPAQWLFSGSLTAPQIRTTLAGDSLQSVAARWAGEGTLSAQELAEENATQPLSAGLLTPAPTRTLSPTADDSLASLAARERCSVGGVAASIAERRGALRVGAVLSYAGVDLLVEDLPAEGPLPAGSSSLTDLTAKLLPWGLVIPPDELGVENALLAQLFAAGVSVDVEEIRVNAGDTLDTMGQLLGFDDYVDAVADTPNLFPAGTALQMGPGGSVAPEERSLAELARVAGLSVTQMAQANGDVPLLAGASLTLPAQVLVSEGTCVPYRAQAGETLGGLAGRFGESASDLLGRDHALRRVFVPDQTIQVGDASTTTVTEDSADSVLARLQAQEPGLTLDDLADAIADQEGLLAEGALWIPLAPSLSSGLTLGSLAANVNCEVGALAQANASLAGLLAAGQPVESGGVSLWTGPAETFTSLVTRLSAAGQDISVADLARALADQAELVGEAGRLLLPPAAWTWTLALRSDVPALAATIRPLSVSLTLSRALDHVHPALRGSPEFVEAQAPMNPDTGQSGLGAPLSLTGFSAALELAFGGTLKVATGTGDAADSFERGLFVVDFGPGGVASLALDRDAPSWFALRPLANRLLDEAGVAIADFDPDTGKLTDETAPLNFQGVDMEVWAETSLSLIERMLSPEYAIPAWQRAPDAFDDIVAAKAQLAEAISQGCANLLAEPANPGTLEAARARLEQALLQDLVSGYGAEAVLQYPVEVQSPWSGANPQAPAPRLHGKLRCTTHKTGESDNLSTLTDDYDVSQSSAAQVLARTTAVLETGAPVSCEVGGVTKSLTPLSTDTLDSLRGRFSDAFGVALSWDQFAYGLDPDEALFAPQVPLNVYVTHTSSGDTAGGQPAGPTFESWETWFAAAVEDLAVANQDKPGVFVDGVTIEANNGSVVVDATNNTLTDIAASLALSVSGLARAIAAETGLLDPAFEVALLRKVPQYGLTGPRLSLASGPGTVNSLFTLSSNDRRSKLFLDLEYALNELEYDIVEAPGTGGYQDSSWLAFVLPIGLGQESDVVDLQPGQLELPVLNRSFPRTPVLGSQSGDADGRASTLEEARRWRYGFDVSFDGASQDELSLRVRLGLHAAQARLARRAEQADFFQVLAQLNAVAPQLSQALTGLLDPPPPTGDDPLTEAVRTLRDLVVALAESWTYDTDWGQAARSGGGTLLATEEYVYRASYTPELDATSGHWVINDLVLTLESGTEGQVGPADAWPELSVRQDDGSWETASPAGDDPGSRLYLLQTPVPAEGSIRVGLSFGGLDVLDTSSALSGTRIVRNRQLISAGDSAEAFVFRAPWVDFLSPLVPYLQRQEVLIFGQGAASRRDALQELFDELLAGHEDALLRVVLAYGFNLVPAVPGVTEGLVSRLPVALRPTGPYVAALPTELDALLVAWAAARGVDANTGITSLDVTLYGLDTSGEPAPLLELQELVYENGG